MSIFTNLSMSDI